MLQDHCNNIHTSVDMITASYVTQLPEIGLSLYDISERLTKSNPFVYISPITCSRRLHWQLDVEKQPCGSPNVSLE